MKHSVPDFRHPAKRVRSGQKLRLRCRVVPALLLLVFAWFNLGRVYLEQGGRFKAKRAFEQALRYDSDLAPAREALNALGKDA